MAGNSEASYDIKHDYYDCTGNYIYNVSNTPTDYDLSPYDSEASAPSDYGTTACGRGSERR